MTRTSHIRKDSSLSQTKTTWSRSTVRAVVASSLAAVAAFALLGKAAEVYAAPTHQTATTAATPLRQPGNEIVPASYQPAPIYATHVVTIDADKCTVDLPGIIAADTATGCSLYIRGNWRNGAIMSAPTNVNTSAILPTLNERVIEFTGAIVLNLTSANPQSTPVRVPASNLCVYFDDEIIAWVNTGKIAVE